MLPGGGMAKGLRELLMEPPVENGPPAWTLQEELLLAHAVVRYGTDDWKMVAQTLEGRAPLRGFGGHFSPEHCEAQFGLLHARCGAPAAGPDGIAGSISSFLRAQRLAELRNGLSLREDSISLLKAKIQSLESARLTLRAQRPVADVSADVIPRHLSANSLPPQQPLLEATAQSLPLPDDDISFEGAKGEPPTAEANGFEADTSSWGGRRPPLHSTPPNGSDPPAPWGGGIPLAGRLLAPTLSQEMASWLASGAAPLFADDGNAASLSEHSGEGSEASDNVPGGRPSPGLNLVVEEHSSGGVGAADVVDDVAGAVEDVDAGEKGGLKADVSPTVTPTSLLEAHAVEALREEGDGGRGPGDGTLRVENESGDELDAGREAGKEAGEKRGAVANEEGEGIDELATEEGERVGQDEAEESVALGVEGGRINDGVKSAEDGRADTDENVPLSSFNKSSREERGAFAVEPEVEEAEGHSTEVPKVASDLKPEERETTELGKKPELGLAKSGRAGVLEGSVEKQSAVKEEVQPEREPLSKSDILGEQTDGAAGVSQAAGDSSEQTADVARMVEETAKEPLEVAGDLAIMKTEREVEGSALEGHGRGAGNGKGGDENGMGGSPVTVTQEQPPEQALEEPEREESQGAEEGEESARAESPDIEARLEQWLRSKMVEREPEPESNPEPEPKPDLSPGPIAEPELDGLLRDESARQLDGEGGVLERKKGDVAEVGETGTEETNGGGREELGGNPVPVPPSLEVESGEASEKAEKDMEISRAEALGDGESVEGDGVEAGSLAEFPDEDRPAMATDREERPEVFEEPLAMSEEGLAVPGLPLAASMERPIAAEDRLIASEDRPIASEDRPIAPGERPIASEDLSTAAEGPPVLSEVVEEEERISGGQDLEPGALQMKNMDEIGARGGDSSLEGTALEEARGALEGEARRPEIEDVAARPEEVSARELASQAIGNKGVEDVNLGTGGAPGAVFEAEGAVEAAELISRPDRGSALLEAADVEVGNEAAIVAEEGAGANGDGVEDPVEADKGGGAQDGLSRLEGVGEGAVDVSGGLSPIELPVQEGNPPSELVSETRLLEESRTGAEETEAGPTEGLESEGTDGNAHTGSSLQAIELGHTRGAQDMEAGEAAVDPPQVSGGVDEGAPAPPTLRLVMEASPGDVYSHDGGAFLYTQKPDAFPSTELNSEASFPKRLFDTSPLPPGGLDLNADAVDDAMGPFDDVTADVMGVGKPVLDLNQEPQEAALLKEGGTLGGKVLAGGAVAAASDGGGNGDAESEGGVMYSAESAPSGAIDQSVVQKVGGCGIAAGVDGDGEGTSPVLGLREIEGEKEEMEAEVEQGRERFDEVNADGNPELAKEQAVGTAEEREGLLEDTAAQSGAEGGGGEVGLRKSNEGPPVTSTPEIGPVEGTTQGEDDREGERVMDRNDGAREGHVEGASNAGISEGPSEIQVPTRMGEKDEDGSGASPKSAESSGSKRKSEEAEVGVAKRAKKETDGGIAKKEALAPFDLNAPVADVSTEAGGDIADVSTEPGGGEVASGGATEGASEPWGVIDIRSVSEGATESEAKQAKGVAGAKGKALRGTALARAVKAQRAAERKAALEAEMQAGGEENEDGEKEEEVSETGGKSAGKQKGGASNTGPARAALAARLLSKAQRRAAAKERGGTPDSTVETPSPRNADVSTPLGSDATCGIDSDDPPSPPVEYDSPDDEPEFVPEGGSDQGPIQPPEPGVAPEGVTEQGATPPLEKGWEKKLKIETGEGEGSREVSPAGGGSAKSVRKGGSRTQPGGVMALCKEVVLSLSAHRAGHLFKDIDYESFPGGNQIERKLDLNTIRHNVDDGVYEAEGSAAFYADVQAMCDNVTAAFPTESGEHVAATALRAFAHGEMGLVWKTEEMIRDGARSSRRPPPKFEPFQATPRKSPLGRSEPGALSGGNGKPSRPQSKGRSRLGTPTGAPREEESEDGNGKEGVEEAEAGGEVEVDTHKGKEGNKKGKGGGKVGGVTPKGGPGGKGKSTPRVEETPTAEEKGSTPKEDGKGGSKQKAKGGAAKGAGRTPSDAKIESSGDATPAGEHKGKSGAKPKASPKSEPKPPSKSHKKQQPASKLERAKKTGGGNKASQAAKASSPGEDEHIEGGKKGKGVKRALESAAEPEKKKSHKKARR